jgi:hypothetical protein
MKRLLLVLILLCILIPINAKGQAFVYKLKETDTGMYSEDGGTSWEKYSEKLTGYIIVEPSDNNTVITRPIDTWTAKDPNGKKQKYYEQQDTMTFGFLQVLVGTKTVWIMTYADEWQSLMLSGTAKSVKIGTITPKPSIATALAGTFLWFDEEDTDIDFSSGKISLSLDTTLTAYGYTHTGEETVAYVITYLTGLHYLPGTE